MERLDGLGAEQFKVEDGVGQFTLKGPILTRDHEAAKESRRRFPGEDKSKYYYSGEVGEWCKPWSELESLLRVPTAWSCRALPLPPVNEVHDQVMVTLPQVGTCWRPIGVQDPLGQTRTELYHLLDITECAG